MDTGSSGKAARGRERRVCPLCGTQYVLIECQFYEEGGGEDGTKELFIVAMKSVDLREEEFCE